MSQINPNLDQPCGLCGKTPVAVVGNVCVKAGPLEPSFKDTDTLSTKHVRRYRIVARCAECEEKAPKRAVGNGESRRAYFADAKRAIDPATTPAA